MSSAQIRQYQDSIEESWDEFQVQLQDNFSLAAVVDYSEKKGLGVERSEWVEYFSSMTLPNSKLKYVSAVNDNEITEMSEVELEYVVGGVAAVPVLAAATVVVAAISGAVVVFAVAVVEASLAVYLSTWAWS